MKTTKILRNTLAAIAVALTMSAMTVSAQAPKYIFYFIGDGMGPGAIMAGQTYNRVVLQNERPLLMMQFPVTSLAMTYSANSPVTDSAAAGTALAAGHKTRNNMLGMDADTIPVYSIAKTLHDDGYGVGIITSVYPDDATPGAFYAHQPSRKMYYEIGVDAAASGYEFIAGSNLRGVKDEQGNPTDLLTRLAQAGYDVVRGTDAADRSQSRKIFLLSPFEDYTSNIGYTIDSLAGAMTLPAMTRSCLAQMERVSPDRFFMMVEGGNIDHAAHANDGGTVTKEVINFNQALQVAYDFYLQHPDETLIVVTADHDTGGLALNKPKEADAIRYIDYQKKSKDIFSDECKAMLYSRRYYTWDEMRELLEANFGLWKYIPVSEAQEQKLREKFAETFERREATDDETLYNSFNAFAVQVFKVLDATTGFAWTTKSHSGNPVPVFAIGVGAERFAPISDNIEIPQRILSIVNSSK